MNAELFWAYLTIGLVSKLLTAKRPTPGEKMVSLPIVFMGAIIVAWFIPKELNLAVIPVLTVFHGGEVAGRLLSVFVDKLRLYRATRQISATLQQYHGNSPQG